MRSFLTFLTSLSISSALAVPATASDRVKFAFSADVEGAEVESLYWSGERYKTGRRCTAPCEMSLKIRNTGPFLFHHKAHGTVRALVPSSSWSDGLKGETIEVDATFLTTGAPTPGGYVSQLEAALSGPDRPAKAVFRIPSPMPPKSVRSGWCIIRFDIDETGRTRNVEPEDCSEPMFENFAAAAIQVWRYIPAIKDGQAVTTEGKTFTMKYQLDDGKGGYFPPKRELPKKG